MLPAERVGTEQVDRVGAEPDVFGFRHQDSKPGEAARRTICTTTSVESMPAGTPGRTEIVAAAAAVCPRRCRRERHWWALPLPDVPAEGLVGCEVGGEVVDVGSVTWNARTRTGSASPSSHT